MCMCNRARDAPTVSGAMRIGDRSCLCRHIRMNHHPRETRAPAGSLIEALVAGADFHDAWCVQSHAGGHSALAHFIAAARATPRWVDTCMTMRNRAGRLVGLKDLGRLSTVTADKPAEAYLPGDRISVFSVLQNTFDEALLVDRDSHLDVTLGIHRQPLAGGTCAMVTVTTVVHGHNMLGRLYMLPVRPMHRLIVPAMLRAIALLPGTTDARS